MRGALGPDAFLEKDQGKIPQELVEEVLTCGTGPGGKLTEPDLSRLMGKRRVEAKRANPEYSLSLFHKLFGSWKCVAPVSPSEPLLRN